MRTSDRCRMNICKLTHSLVDVCTQLLLLFDDTLIFLFPPLSYAVSMVAMSRHIALRILTLTLFITHALAAGQTTNTYTLDAGLSEKRHNEHSRVDFTPRHGAED